MLSIEQHLARILEEIEPLEPFGIGLLDARGCIVSEEVHAAWPLPLVDTADEDGYAVRLADVARASDAEPARLEVTDVVLPGDRPARSVTPGRAIRVAAGAALPEGAEAVIAVGHTDAGMSTVEVRRSAPAGRNIRRVGEDLAAGGVVVSAGAELDARAIGLLAAVGRTSVQARPRPRVVVLTVGSELVEAGNAVAPGQLADVNGPMLAAACAEAGAAVYRVGPLATDFGALKRVLEDQLVRADLVVAVGGAAAAAYDTLQKVGNELGQVRFDRVAMQPGSAQGFGRIGDEYVPVLVLPANPVAAFLSFEIFVRPVIRRLQGRPDAPLRLSQVESAAGFNSVPERRHFLRANRQADGRVMVSADQAPHLVAGLAAADGFVVVPELVEEVRAGDLVDVLWLRSPAEA